jgi:hypothetical protein
MYFYVLCQYTRGLLRKTYTTAAGKQQGKEGKITIRRYTSLAHTLEKP